MDKDNAVAKMQQALEHAIDDTEEMERLYVEIFADTELMMELLVLAYLAVIALAIDRAVICKTIADEFINARHYKYTLMIVIIAHRYLKSFQSTPVDDILKDLCDLGYLRAIRYEYQIRRENSFIGWTKFTIFRFKIYCMRLARFIKDRNDPLAM